MDIFVVQFATAEGHDADDDDLDFLVCRRHARQQPRDFRGMRELDVHFVHDAVRADRAAEQADRQVRRMSRTKKVAVEAAQFVPANSTGHGRDVVDGRMPRQGVDGLVGILVAEFQAEMRLPHGFDVKALNVKRRPEHRQRAGPGQRRTDLVKLVQVVFGKARHRARVAVGRVSRAEFLVARQMDQYTQRGWEIRGRPRHIWWVVRHDGD